MRALAAILTLALLAGGCSGRDRANPLDPANPSTHGRPSHFVALAGNSTVTLTWDVVAVPGLLGYRLERRVAGDTDFTVLVALLPATTGAYFDFGLLNGARHDYRLSFVFDTGPSGGFATDFAIPGPLRPWVTVLGTSELLRITADGRRVIYDDPLFGSPSAVAVDPAQGVVWVSDGIEGTVVRFNPGNGSRLVIPRGATPGAIAVDPVRHTAWVCDERGAQIVQIQLDGSPGSPPAIGPLELPLDVAIDGQDGSVWVCDNRAGKLLQFGASGASRFERNVPQPSRVAIDSLTRDAWVTSFGAGTLVRVAFNGTVLDTVTGLAGPIGVAVDARRGRVWVADARANALVAFHRDGTVERRIGGLSEVHEVRVDIATGNVWATVPGDGRVVQVSPAGVILSQVSGLAQPWAIALDPGSELAFGAPRRAGAEGGQAVHHPSLRYGSTTTLRTAAPAPATSRTQ